ncbi:hypothetical protein [Pantoea endophytica]
MKTEKEIKQDLSAECRRTIAEMEQRPLTYRDHAQLEIYRIALVFLTTEQAVVPGWQLVPIEPTRQMMSQGHFAMAGTDRGKFRRIYMAMIAAAPEVSE